MTTPTSDASSGVAANAANLLPSAASSVRSLCETAAPRRTGIGGAESRSKHTRRVYGLRRRRRAWAAQGKRQECDERKHGETMHAGVTVQAHKRLRERHRMADVGSRASRTA